MTITKRQVFLVKRRIASRRKDILAWWALWLRRRGHTYQQIADMTGTWRGNAAGRVYYALALEHRRTGRELRILQRNASAELRAVRALRAYEMRYAGHTFKEIGDRFQISRERARQIVYGECLRRCRVNRIHWRGLEMFEESLRTRG